jgi:hypothetical protein
MAKKITLEDAIALVDPEINKILSTDYRKVLDKRITILDLSYDALKVNVYRNTKAHLDAYNSAYAALVEVLNEKATRQYKSLDELPDGYFNKANAPFVYINGGDDHRFLVANNFGNIRTFVTEKISRDPRLLRTSFGQSTIYDQLKDSKGRLTGDTKKRTRTKVDIGHIATESEQNLVSPLEMKISDILALGERTANPVIVKEAQRALSDLYAIQAEASYSFKNTTPEAVNTARSKLGEFYVVVTLHREKLNARFSDAERDIFNKLKANLALKLSKLPFDQIQGSNTIIEDLAEQYANILAGKGKKLRAHTTHKSTKKHKVKGKTTVGSESISIKKPPTTAPQNIDLLGLQNLINYHLQDIISANMGDGNRHDILNFRTGRFAASVKVEKLTMSRSGMITAFYSYMKNPYATFSEGGRQSRPRTRDPKLLISQSIREIAAQKVAEKLRAVSV